MNTQFNEFNNAEIFKPKYIFKYYFTLLTVIVVALTMLLSSILYGSGNIYLLGGTGLIIVSVIILNKHINSIVFCPDKIIVKYLLGRKKQESYSDVLDIGLLTVKMKSANIPLMHMGNREEFRSILVKKLEEKNDLSLLEGNTMPMEIRNYKIGLIAIIIGLCCAYLYQGFIGYYPFRIDPKFSFIITFTIFSFIAGLITSKFIKVKKDKNLDKVKPLVKNARNLINENKLGEAYKICSQIESLPNSGIDSYCWLYGLYLSMKDLNNAQRVKDMICREVQEKFLKEKNNNPSTDIEGLLWYMEDIYEFSGKKKRLILELIEGLENLYQSSSELCEIADYIYEDLDSQDYKKYFDKAKEIAKTSRDFGAIANFNETTGNTGGAKEYLNLAEKNASTANDYLDILYYNSETGIGDLWGWVNKAFEKSLNLKNSCLTLFHCSHSCAGHEGQNGLCEKIIDKALGYCCKAKDYIDVLKAINYKSFSGKEIVTMLIKKAYSCNPNEKEREEIIEIKKMAKSL